MNKELIEKLINEYDKRLSVAKDQYDYYRGKSDVIKNYPLTDRSNRKVSDNFIRTFIEEEVSFMVGQDATYTSNDIELKDNILSVLSGLDETLDLDLTTNLLIFGESYELYYLNNGEFKVKELNPLNSIAYCDTEGNALMLIYFYKKELDDAEYYDVIDGNGIYTYKKGIPNPIAAMQHYFGSCPVSVARLTNGVDDTLYNNLKTLQDAYEYAMSDYSNEISDTRLAYLVLSGLSIDDEEAKKMKQMGILQLPESDGRAEWLIKNINSDFVRSYRDIIKEDIYRVANHIDNQEGVQSNTSGTMLITRMNCLRLKITSQNKCVKNAIKTRLKHICTYLNLTLNKEYDYKSVRIDMQINMPYNDVETAQIMTQLTDKLSIRTGLSRLSFVQEPDKEFERMLEEKKMINDTFEPEVNLDNVPNEPVEGDSIE